MQMLLPTSLVGSYPQPEWLIDRERLSKQVPRVRADDLWLVPPEKLEARKTTRPSSPSVTRSAPDSTSSLTASNAGKVTPIVSPPRSMASMSKIPAR